LLRAGLEALELLYLRGYLVYHVYLGRDLGLGYVLLELRGPLRLPDARSRLGAGQGDVHLPDLVGYPDYLRLLQRVGPCLHYPRVHPQRVREFRGFGLAVLLEILDQVVDAGRYALV